MKYFQLVFGFVILLNPNDTIAQEKPKSFGEIHGNFEATTQYYIDDTIIGAPPVPEKVLMNGFLNLIYTKDKFEAGVRYESYQNALLGFSPDYKGNGIPFRYAKYSGDDLEITVGSFYEQFGNGQILRFYEARSLGFDNALDGIRVKYNVKGLNLTGLIGEQRWYFSKGPGIVRGLNGDWDINEAFEKLEKSKTRLSIGSSVVSKYQEDNNLNLTLPENVMTYGGRFSLYRSGFSLKGEYTYKYNDPTSDNGYIYKPGQAFFLTGAYSQKGFGIAVSAKTIDNMFYRSDRNNSSIFNDLLINYIPALTKQHTYNLMGTLYPYATQPRGEVAYQADVIYTFKRKSVIGGKYGTTLQVNYSFANNIDTTHLNDENTTRLGYETKLFSLGEQKYYSDFNVEISKKFSKKIKTKLTYQNLFYNIDVIQGKPGESNVIANVFVADVLYKFNSKNAIRTELQGLFTDQDQGDWSTFVIEYTNSPHWFVAIQDQYNNGNKNVDKRIHYFYSSVGYIKGANRITLNYGKQRAGIFCVGGVCRTVPASNGVNLSITSSF